MRMLLLALLIAAMPLGEATAQEPPKFTPEQQEKLKERDKLLREVAVSKTFRQFGKAAALVEKILVLERGVFGETHAKVLARVEQLAELQVQAGDFAAAKKSWAELLALRTKVLGKSHWQTIDAKVAMENAVLMAGLNADQRELLEEANAWNNQANELYEERKFGEAIVLAEKFVRVRKDLLGDKHPDYALGLNNLANLYFSQGLYPKAEPLFVEALKIRKEVLGEKHPHYAFSLNMLANLYVAENHCAKAEPLYLDALRIVKEALGDNDIQYAEYSNNLADMYRNCGQYAKAEPLCLDALRIVKEVLGEKHPHYATTLNNLAGLYETRGQYAKAEPLFVDALRIYKEALGDKHPDYALGLNNLAGLYAAQGQYAKAEPLHAAALRIRKEVLGEKHPDYAASLNNLAHLYETLSQYAKAEPLYIDALRIIKETLGDKHPYYSACLNNLAVIYKSQGQYAKAEPVYLDALRITKAARGDKHPSYANCLNNLAVMYEYQRQYVKAEPLYVDALRITKEALGEKHPDYAMSLNNLAHLYGVLGQYAKAEPMYVQSLRIVQANLEDAAAIQSESDQIRHIAISRSYLDNYLAMPQADATALFNIVFRWHGSVTARQTFARATRMSSPDIQASIQQLRDISRQMNQLVQNPPQGMAKAEQVKQIKELDGQRENIEKKLAGQSQDFAAYQSQRKLAPADLQKSMPDDTALLDFLVHGETTSVFVITKKSIVRIQLGTGKDIADEITAFTADLSLMRTRPVTNQDDISAKLRKRIWEPLEEHLKGITRVLICPDGPLCRLPFAALPGADPKKYLLEELSIVVVPVPQLLPALLATEAKKFTGAPSLLAVGDVDFDGDPAAGEKPTKPLPVALIRSGNGLSWSRLPNTKGEVEVVETLFGKLPQATVKKFLGNDATEAAIERELSRHRFVHLATHGFFTPPKMVRQFQEDQAIGGEKILLPTIPPGLSSGIVCAGANKPTFQVSGVITATQIAELDLRNVELAVLSACETSLGELSGGEGVLGLQRAFQMAGARSTITTMWAIPDQSTAELMKRMYSNRLENGLAAAEALREAQIWVLNNGEKVGAFQEKPTGSKRTPPKFWAAFSFAGDWR